MQQSLAYRMVAKMTRHLGPFQGSKTVQNGNKIISPSLSKNRFSKTRGSEILREKHYVNTGYYYCWLAGVWDIYFILFNHPDEAKCPRDVESAHHYAQWVLRIQTQVLPVAAGAITEFLSTTGTTCSCVLYWRQTPLRSRICCYSLLIQPCVLQSKWSLPC